MTDKLYNGFREGRAPGDHKPNNQVRGMTQETMTKEQILEKNNNVRIFDQFYDGKQNIIRKVMRETTEDLAKQIQQRKEAILKQRFEAEGYLHLLEGLDKQRFKRVLLEVSGDEERWFADNGTDEGVLVVTIVTKISYTYGEKLTFVADVIYY
jgi:hypothetical protein